MALLQAYAEAIPHSEEGTFQTQPPSQKYCYRYLDEANRTFNEVNTPNRFPLKKVLKVKYGLFFLKIPEN